MTERWLPIGEAPGYSVSDLGRVRNDQTRKLLKPFPRGYHNEYLGVNLYRFGVRRPYLVHRLVAKAFLPDPPSALHNEVNHFDVDTRNNRVTNLEWVTRQENEAHKRFMEATAV